MLSGGGKLKEIYLDNSATTRVLKEAADAAYSAMTENYGNPSSLHKKGIEAEEIMNAARKEIAAYKSYPFARITVFLVRK